MANSIGARGMLVDPTVSRARFAREIERFETTRDLHNRRGCWLIKAEFPIAIVVFAALKSNPPFVLFAARFDFTNYDLVPPSVRLVDPFTHELLKAKQVKFQLLRRALVTRPPGEMPFGAMLPEQIQNLLQDYGPEELPFVCLQGIREYHDHPLHSNDPWLPRRKTGEGTLHFLVEQLWTYGVEQVVGMGYTIQIVPNGFQIGGVPS
ncbi:MAG: hypothetical protein QM758_13730 [Armatimonas sp.]